MNKLLTLALWLATGYCVLRVALCIAEQLVAASYVPLLLVTNAAMYGICCLFDKPAR